MRWTAARRTCAQAGGPSRSSCRAAFSFSCFFTWGSVRSCRGQTRQLPPRDSLKTAVTRADLLFSISGSCAPLFTSVSRETTRLRSSDTLSSRLPSFFPRSGDGAPGTFKEQCFTRKEDFAQAIPGAMARCACSEPALQVLCCRLTAEAVAGLSRDTQSSETQSPLSS